jgi:N-acetylglucosaminyl-diphospho-decaprenol L-rhamnosyltransferase
MKHDVSLAALVVNYNTGSYAECCVESLLHEWRREGRAREKLSIVVVDNASPEPQEPFLARIEALGAKVVRAGENLGYARGMNLAYEHTRGAPGDVVAILNPDLHFLPAALGTLIDYVLDHPDVGVVDPTTSVDPLGVINLPPNLLPTPLEHVRITFANMHPLFARAYARYRQPQCLRWWSSREPVETDMLSGCCLFMRRAVIDELGRVMDPRYPLYFEDTDLFRTLSRKGYKVVHHTRARILHHWSRSAKIGGAPDDGPTQRFEVSREAYYRKFYGPFGRGLYAGMNAIGRRWPRHWIGRAIQPMTPLGELHQPFAFELPRPARFLIEMSVHPAFVICSGTFGTGQRWSCPPEAWEWFFPLEYFARVIDLDTREVLAAYSFRKSDACRNEAMRPSEIEALGERLLSHAPLR